MNVCRICLTSGPSKDIFEDYIDESSDENNYVNIIKFCLDIQLTKHTTASKLCANCVTKLLTFYEFKTLAIKNDTFLQTLHEDVVEIEEIISENTEIIQFGENSCCDDVRIKDVTNNIEIKDEKVEYDGDLTPENKIITEKDSRKERSLHKPIIEENTKESRTMCHKCGKTVKCIENHMCSQLKIHLKSTDKKFPCEQCSKVFANPNSRKRHVKSIHLGIKSICKICNKGVSALSHHMKVMHERASLRHECSVCARRYYTASQLASHVNTHTRTRPFQCDHCSKCFTTKPLLQNHIRSIHLKEKSFLCQVCSKGFFKQHHLNEHLKCHTKDMPYKCEECNKHFARKSSLQSHQLLHSKEKNIECPHCDMTFFKKSYLTSHMVTHTKEKRHICRYCGAKFARGDYRKHHEFTAHQKHFLTSTTLTKK